MRLIWLLVAASILVAAARDCSAHGGYAADGRCGNLDAQQLEWIVCEAPGALVCLTEWTVVRVTPCGWKWEHPDGRRSNEWCCPAGAATPTEDMLALGLDPPEKSWFSVRTRFFDGTVSANLTCDGRPEGFYEACGEPPAGVDACCNGVDDDGDGTVDEGCVTHRPYMGRDPSSGYCRVEGGPVTEIP